MTKVNAGGCDRYKGGDHVKQTLAKVAREYCPDLIIYEGIMYSITFKMAREISELCTKIGYSWRSLYLFREYDSMMKLLEERNKGKIVNMQAVFTKWERAMVVYRKLLESGRDVKMINVTGMSKEQLAEALENEVCTRKNR